MDCLLIRLFFVASLWLFLFWTFGLGLKKFVYFVNWLFFSAQTKQTSLLGIIWEEDTELRYVFVEGKVLRKINLKYERPWSCCYLWTQELHLFLLSIVGYTSFAYFINSFHLKSLKGFSIQINLPNFAHMISYIIIAFGL